MKNCFAYNMFVGNACIIFNVNKRVYLEIYPCFVIYFFIDCAIQSRLDICAVKVTLDIQLWT